MAEAARVDTFAAVLHAKITFTSPAEVGLTTSNRSLAVLLVARQATVSTRLAKEVVNVENEMRGASLEGLVTPDLPKERPTTENTLGRWPF